MYWTFQEDMAMMNGIIMKGKCVVIPEVLKAQALDQLYINYMGIEKPSSWHVNYFIRSI